MAAFSSVQETNRTATPRVLAKPSEEYGKQRVSYFEFTTPAASDPTTGDTINLTFVPSGARILGIHLAFEAAGAGITLDVGTTVAAQSQRYAATIDVSSAGASNVAGDTIANNFGDSLTADTIIMGTVGGGTWAATKKLFGFVTWVLD